MNIVPYNQRDLQLRELQYTLIERLNKPTQKSQRKNISTQKWGSNAWSFIEKIIEGYPTNATKDEQIKMMDFIVSLTSLLPCKTCRKNFKQYIETNEPFTYLAKRKLIKQWFENYKNLHRNNK